MMVALRERQREGETQQRAPGPDTAAQAVCLHSAALSPEVVLLPVWQHFGGKPVQSSEYILLRRA